MSFRARSDSDDAHPSQGEAAPAPGRRTLTAQLAPRARPSEPQPAETPGRLPPDLGASMGGAFGLDLSNTPVVIDSAAAMGLGARAFASRGELHFASGEYAPGTMAGRELIGHEVAHLSQQAEGRTSNAAHAKGADLGTDRALEAEADDLGRRAAHGETGLRGGGVLRTPLTSATAIQRKQTEWEDFKENKVGVQWKPHRTEIEGKEEAGDALGTGGRVTGVTAGPATAITYTGAGAADLGRNIKAGGLGVEATLGPNHPDGAKPPAWTTPGALDAIATGAPGKYERVQLLPGALGGSASTDNLVALPPAAAIVVQDLHARAHRLVHEKRIFISYVVRVTEAKDAAAAAAPYASRVEIVWSQLKNDGGAIADATGTRSVDVPTPTQYGGGTEAKAATPHVNDAGAANAAILPVGATVKHADARADFTTHITFGAVNADGDGTSMEAHRLGPDHKVGDQPGDGAWNKRTKALAAEAGYPKLYVAGHLLNHHLGGPGDDQRNLAPIPADANDLHESKVESVIKNLVNVQGAWVYYKVRVTHATDALAGVDYPSALVCTWHQLDRTGNRVGGTEGATTISINSPSEYAGGKVPPKKKLPTGAKATAVTVDASDGKASGTTARTVLAYDQVLLEDSTTLKYQMRVMQPLVARLKALGLEPTFAENEAIGADLKTALDAATPGLDEAVAGDQVELIAAHLSRPFGPREIPNKRHQIGSLRQALHELQTAFGNRQRASATATRTFFARYLNVAKATEIVAAIEGEMRKDMVAFGKLVAAAEHALGFGEFTINQLERTRGSLSGLDEKSSRWSGRRPAEDDAEPELVAKNAWEGVGRGTKHMVDAADGTMSPMQTISVAHQETGGSPSSQAAAVSALVARRGSVDMAPAESKKPASKALDAVVLEAAAIHGAGWPKWKPDSSEVDAIASTIETLIAARVGPALEVTVRSLYKTNTAAFARYVEWLVSRLPKS